MIREKRLKEVFTSGTAVTIGSVESFNFEGEEFKIEVDKEKGMGLLTYEIYKQITDIQYGRVEHEWSDIVQ